MNMPSRSHSIAAAFAILVVCLIPWPLSSAARLLQESPSTAQAAPGAPVDKEETIAEMTSGANVKAYSWLMQTNSLNQLQNGPRMSYFLPDRRRVAWIERQGNAKVFLVNGKPVGNPYDKNDPIRIVTSDDGGHFAVQGVRDKMGVINFDGKELRADFDEVFGMTISRDGRKLAHGAKKGKEWSLLVNGERVAGPFDTIPTSLFSPNGEHIAYAAKRGKSWVVGLDGKDAALDVKVLRIYVVGTDRLAYAAEKGGECFYVVDGKEGPHFDVLGTLMMSADGRRHAYGCAQNKMRVVVNRAIGRLVVDGKPGQEFEGRAYDNLWSVFVSHRGCRFARIRTKESDADLRG